MCEEKARGLFPVRRRILRMGRIVLAAFSVLLAYVFYLSAAAGDALFLHPLNRRGAALPDGVPRGAVLDRTGARLAWSGGDGVRRYPLGEAAAHVVGYAGDRTGAAGVEGRFQDALLGRPPYLRRLGPAAQLLAPARGADVYLTLDAALQQTAYDALAGRRGAVVALDAETGAVLAMASRPSFDPEALEEDWETVSSGEDGSVLLNRAVSGFYPPGSAIKPLIAAAALSAGAASPDEIFDCGGALSLDGGYEIGESGGARHGRVTLEEALAVSCNVTFARLALRLGGAELAKAFARFGFDRAAGGGLGAPPPELPDFSSLGQGDTAQIGIGQGPLLVTPLSMAMMASAFANGGRIMEPYLADTVCGGGGAAQERARPALWREAVRPEVAARVSGYMETAVRAGTGQAARADGVRVAGKTGTAENPGGEDHAWFVGTAAQGARRLAFAVLVENGGGGGRAAAPVARALIEQWRE